MSVLTCNPGQGLKAVAPVPVLEPANSTSKGIWLLWSTLQPLVNWAGSGWPFLYKILDLLLISILSLFSSHFHCSAQDAVCGMVSYFKKWSSAVGIEGSAGTEIKGKSIQIIGSLLPAQIR